MAERDHHRSKRRHYSVVLVPNEDASSARNYRFAPWQLGALGGAAVALVLGAFVALLYWTPLSAWLQIPNPELEQRYGTEVVALNERMVGLLGQLVELRTYNAMLRNALGEKSAVDTSKARTSAYESPARLSTLNGATRTPGSTVEQRAVLPPVSADRPAAEVFPAFFPVDGYVSRGFEPDKGHYGIDIAGRSGSPVRCAADGHVVFAGWTQLDGNIVIVSHAGGFLTFYKHNQSLIASPGAFIRRGDPVATLGTTGETSTGPHVHFEVWKDGAALDPSLYLLNPNS